MSGYPGAIDVLTDPVSSDQLDAPLSHTDAHKELNDCIEKIEAALGINPQGASASVVARLVATDAAVAAKENAGVAATLDAAHVAALDPHTVYQKNLDKRLVVFCQGNIGGANVSFFPTIFAVAGTAQFRGYGATFFSQQRRTGYTTTAVAGSTSANVRCNASWNAGHGVAGGGGFKAVCRFGISDAVLVSTGRIRCAMTTQNAIGDVEPYGAIDLSIGVACDGAIGETNFFAFCNTFNSPTKVNLGANFPANTTGVDWYECTITRESGATEATVRLERLNTGHVVTTTLSGANLPGLTTNMAIQVNRSNGGTAAAVGLDFGHIYVREGPNP